MNNKYSILEKAMDDGRCCYICDVITKKYEPYVKETFREIRSLAFRSPRTRDGNTTYINFKYKRELKYWFSKLSPEAKNLFNMVFEEVCKKEFGISEYGYPFHYVLLNNEAHKYWNRLVEIREELLSEITCSSQNIEDEITKEFKMFYDVYPTQDGKICILIDEYGVLVFENLKKAAKNISR